MDSTNRVSSDKSGLQMKFLHEVPHLKYVNCHNHKLALIFVHLFKDERFEVLRNVDSIIIKVWKLMKYSSIKAAMFGEPQVALNQEKHKLLKTATTCWLSGGEVFKLLVSRFITLLDSLDSIFRENNDNDMKVIEDDLFEPNIILMLLLVTDLLVYIYHFSTFLQKKYLLHSSIATKFKCLNEAVRKLLNEDGPLLTQFAREFLKTLLERMELARRTQNNNLLNLNNEINDKKVQFKEEIKQQFLEDVIQFWS